MIWKKIDGWPYEISRCGVVRSLPRSFITNDNRELDYPGGRIMSIQYKKYGGEEHSVKLSFNGKVRIHRIHRLLSSCHGAGAAAEYVENHPPQFKRISIPV